MSTSPFPLPIMFTGWAFRDGSGAVNEVIRRAKLMGARSIAVQLSEDTPADSTDAARTLDPSDVAALQQAGFFVVGWDAAGAATAGLLADLKVNGWLPQVETAAQLDALIAALNAGVGQALPRAVVTTFGGLDTPAAVVRLKQASIDTAFIECYRSDDPIHADIDRMLGQAVIYGFAADKVYAIVGSYRGEMPADYPGLDKRGRQWGLYIEEMTADPQLDAFAKLNATAPVPAPAPAPTPAPTPTPAPGVDPADCNRRIAAIADTYLTQFLPDLKSLTRLRCERDIATCDDGTWVARRRDVRAAIDGQLDVTTIDLLQKQLAGVRAELATAKQQLADMTSERDQLRVKLAGEVDALNQAQAKIAAARADLL